MANTPLAERYLYLPSVGWAIAAGSLMARARKPALARAVALLLAASFAAGALLLLSFYLSMPPFPWLPENLRAEGHYLFVNKNLIEMLALLALATVPSGRWVGFASSSRSCRPPIGSFLIRRRFPARRPSHGSGERPG